MLSEHKHICFSLAEAILDPAGLLVEVMDQFAWFVLTDRYFFRRRRYLIGHLPQLQLGTRGTTLQSEKSESFFLYQTS